jgi:hypothetical protein
MTNPSVSSTSTVMSTFMGDPAEAGVNLTPEGLMLYLQSRLGDVDTQIDGLFKKQQDVGRIREDLNAIQKELQNLKNDTSDKSAQGTPNTDSNGNGQIDPSEYADFEKRITDAIADIKEVEPALGEKLESELGQVGYILDGRDGQYVTSEVKNSTDYLNSINKELESSAQLEMIKLQSLMSSRQTAIQLSTNLVSALGDSTKSIASNIGR